MSAARQLGSRLHPRTAASLAELVRVMNCYYSNLISFMSGLFDLANLEELLTRYVRNPFACLSTPSGFRWKFSAAVSWHEEKRRG